MTPPLSASERAKKASATAALEFIEPGMRLGLGTGSTAAWLVKLIGEKARGGSFDLMCVPTSSRTRDLALECGLKVGTLDEAGWLDLTIDGADEFDADLNLIKGGGGALLQEKIVAAASDKMVVITDPSKQVDHLGAFPLPVEIVPFGWEVTRTIISEMLGDLDVSGQQISLRMNRDKPFITDEGHYIVDLHLRRIGSPKRLAALLNQVPGVVENGLFIGLAQAVVIGQPDGTAEVIERPKAAGGDVKNREAKADEPLKAGTADDEDGLFDGIT